MNCALRVRGTGYLCRIATRWQRIFLKLEQEFVAALRPRL